MSADVPTPWRELIDDATLSEVSLGGATVDTETAGSQGRRLAEQVALAEAAAGRGYRLLGSLGTGGMGTVLLARQLALQRDVAIKTLLRSDQEAVQRFQGEAQVTGRLAHPFIVPAHDAGEDFLVMRRVDGSTLADWLRTYNGPVDAADLPELVAVLAKVADALAYAHDSGVVHRDIKPANIMIGAHDEVQVVDWGLAVVLADGAMPDGTGPGGTPAYAAPEQVTHDREIGPATDVFLLGSSLYRALCGRPPYADRVAAKALQAAGQCQAEPVATTNPDAPGELIAVQEACMQPKPGDRPDASAVADRLRAWIGHRASWRRARELDDRFASLLTGVEDRVPADRHAVYAEAMALVAEAIAVDATPARLGRRDRVAQAAVTAALDADDLGLAGALLRQPEVGHAAGTLVARYEQAVSRRQGRSRRLRQLTVAAVILALAAVSGVAWLLHWQAAEDERQQAARQQDVRALLREAMAIDPASLSDPAGRLAAHDHRLSLARRAWGLSGGEQTVQRPARQWAEAFADEAIAQGSWGLAEERLPFLHRLDATATADRLQAAIAAERDAAAAAVAERRQRFERHVAALRYPRLGGWLKDPARTVVGWPVAETTPLLHALVDDRKPLVRLFLATCLERRRRAEDRVVLEQLIDDDEPAISDLAWQALARQRDPALLPQLLDHLLRDIRHADIRRLQVHVGSWLAGMAHPLDLPATGDQAAQRQRQVLAAIIAGEADVAVALVPHAAAGIDALLLGEALAQLPAASLSRPPPIGQPDALADWCRARRLAGDAAAVKAALADQLGERTDTAWTPSSFGLLVEWLHATKDGERLQTLVPVLLQRWPAADWQGRLGALAELLDAAGMDELARTCERRLTARLTILSEELADYLDDGQLVQARALYGYLQHRFPGCERCLPELP